MSKRSAKDDGGAFDERKLKPIHEAIDGGNYKQGIKLINAAMAKAGKKPVLIALLALSHAYMHASDEATSHLAQLPPLDQMDPITFNTVVLVYRVMDDVPNLIRCYEASVAKNPKDEELHVQLYFALLRTDDYAKLQTQAMKLYTSFKKDKYLVWSAVNLLLQKRNTPPATKKNPDKLMQLHEMMFHRTFQHPTFPRTLSIEDLLVLLRLYNRQSKFEEGVKLLESESGLAFKEKDGVEYLRIKAQLLHDLSTSLSSADENRPVDSLQRRYESASVYQELVTQNNDDWFFLTEMIKAEIEIGEKQEAMGQVEASTVPFLTFDARIAQLRTFLSQLQAKNMNQPPIVPPTSPTASAVNVAAPNPPSSPSSTSKRVAGQALKRGPFLAEVELEFRLCQRENKKKHPALYATPAPITASSSTSSTTLASSSSSSSVSSTPSLVTTPPAVVLTVDTSGFERAFVQYYRQFGSKSCFYNDVLPYLDSLSQSVRVRITNTCMSHIPALLIGPNASLANNATNALEAVTEVMSGLEFVAEASSSTLSKEALEKKESESVKRFQFSLSIQQLMRYNYSMEIISNEATTSLSASAASLTTSPQASVPNLSQASSGMNVVSALSSTAVAMAAAREKDLESSGKSMLEQFLSSVTLQSSILRVQSERGVGDDYLILFVHHYFSLYLQTKNKTYLLDVIMALEVGITRFSIHNYQFKLFLIRLYSHPEIAAFERSYNLYRSLDIKQIQHEITSHLVLDDSIRMGSMMKDTAMICGKIANWHVNADREEMNCIQFSYERLNYSKVLEFIEFKERRHGGFSLYQARVYKAYSSLLALGVNPTTGLATNTNAIPLVQGVEKDLTSIHAALGKIRKDLSEKYPWLNSSSSVSELQSKFVVNNDFTILSIWDTISSTNPALYSVFNRPAPSLYASSFDLPHREILQRRGRSDEIDSVVPQETHTFQLSKAAALNTMYLRTVFELLWHIFEQDTLSVRREFNQLKTILQQMNLLDLSAVAVATATTTPESSLQSFHETYWKFQYLMFDTSANILDVSILTQAYVDGYKMPSAEKDDSEEASAAKKEQHLLRWNDLSRQLGVLSFLLERMTHDVQQRFYLAHMTNSAEKFQHSLATTNTANAQHADELQKVVYGEYKDPNASVETDRPVNPLALRDIALLLQFGFHMLVMLIQSWSVSIPNKKAFKKMVTQGPAAKKRTSEISTDEENELFEPMLTVRVALASLIKVARSSFATVQTLLKNVATRASATSTTSLITQAQSPAPGSKDNTAVTNYSFLEVRSSLSALQNPELANVMQSVLTHIDQSHGAAAATMLQLLVSIEQPLSQLKL